MKDIINKIKENKTLIKFIEFMGIGFIATIMDYVTMIVLKEVFYVDILIASGVGFIVGLVFNYIYNMTHVFTDLKEGMTVIKSSTIFLVTSLIGLLFNQMIMYVLVERLFIHYILSKLFSIAIVGLWNFFSKKMLIEK